MQDTFSFALDTTSQSVIPGLGAPPPYLSGVVAHQHTPRHPDGGGIPSPRAWPPGNEVGPNLLTKQFRKQRLNCK